MNDPLIDLDRYQLVICLGPGGVGKTTLSAALSLRAAIDGRAVDALTIDPAPRLLEALTLEQQSSEPCAISLAGLAAKPGGQLRALKLDPQRMFDKLVERYAPSVASRDAILSDRIYRNLSAALSGVADYMAMEQLLDLRHEGFADLIVLDTPPAREAIDFLDAPRRMLDLLNSRALTLLGASREMMRGPFGIFDFAARAVLTAFDRLTGLHLLADVQSFVTRFDGMYGGFAARAGQARELIESEKTLIILVTTADTERLEQPREFITSLRGLGLRADAIAINRMMPPLPDGTAIDSVGITATLKRKLRRNLQDFGALKQRENASLRMMRAEAPPDTPIIIAPDLGREPSTLADLAEIASQLRVLT